jgi:MFS family permease
MLTCVAIVAATLAVTFVGATLPTPLYPLYRHAFGFGTVTLALIYASYVVGNLLALLVFGRVSDQVGRRKVILPAIACAFVSTLAFAFATNPAWLFVARSLSGLGTGVVSGAATAWIAEILGASRKRTATSWAVAANFLGLAAGPLLAGLLAQTAPWPLRLAYIVYLPVLVVIALLLRSAPETVTKRVRSLRDLSLRPRFAIPAGIRARFVSPAVAAFATFALVGFYAALIPSLLAESLHVKAPLAAAGVVFELFVVAAATTGLTARLSPRDALLIGLALLIPSVGLLVAAQVSSSMPLLLAATALAGISGALGYRGSLEIINKIAPDDRRSEVVSSYLVTVYSGNALPVIGVGILSTFVGSVTADIAFAALIAVLGISAWTVGFKYIPQG